MNDGTEGAGKNADRRRPERRRLSEGGWLAGGRTIAVVGLPRAGKTLIANHMTAALSAYAESLIVLDMGSTRNLQAQHEARVYDSPVVVQRGPTTNDQLNADCLHLVDSGTGFEVPARLTSANVHVVVVGDTNSNHEVQRLARQLGAPTDGGPRRIVVWCERRGSRRTEPRPTWDELAGWFRVPLKNAFEVPYCSAIPVHINLGLTLWHEVAEEPVTDELLQARRVLRDITEAALREVQGCPPRPDQLLRFGLEHLASLPERVPTVRIPPPDWSAANGPRRHDPYARVLGPRVEQRVSIEDLPEDEQRRLPHRALPWEEMDPLGSPLVRSLRIDQATRETLVRLDLRHQLDYAASIRLALSTAADAIEQGAPVVGFATGPRRSRISVRLDAGMERAIEVVRGACGDATASRAEVVCWAVRRLVSAANPF